MEKLWAHVDGRYRKTSQGPTEESDGGHARGVNKWRWRPRSKYNIIDQAAVCYPFTRHHVGQTRAPADEHHPGARNARHRRVESAAHTRSPNELP